MADRRRRTWDRELAVARTTVPWMPSRNSPGGCPEGAGEKVTISHTVRVLGEFSAVRTLYDIGRPNREPAFGVSRLCLGTIGRP